MDVVSGKDAYTSSGGMQRLLSGIRSLTALADGSGDADAIFRALAAELLEVPGAEEVHVHHLAEDGAADDIVDVYLLEGEGRLSYLSRSEEHTSELQSRQYLVCRLLLGNKK